MDTAQLPLVMTVYAVMFAGFLLLGGRAGDALGHRRVFLVGMAVYALGALGSALAPSAMVLLVARGLQGLGAAISGPPALALVAAVFPDTRERAKAMGVYTAVGASSFSVGLVLGGVLTSLSGWRSAFVVLVPIAVVVVAAGRRLLPAGRVAREHSLDLPGAALITGGLVCTVFGVAQAERAGFASPVVLGLVGAGIAMLVGFVVRERMATVPLLPLSLLSGRPVQAATAAGLVFYTAVNGLLFFAPLYMQGVLGYSAILSGLAIVPMGVTVILASQVAGRLMPRIGQRALMSSGLTLIAIGVATWVTIGPMTSYVTGLLPGIVIMSIGQAFAFTGMTAASLTGVPEERRGVAGGLNITCQQVGSGLGVAIIATIAATVEGTSDDPASVILGYHAGIAAAAAAGLLGAVATFALYRPDRTNAGQADAGRDTVTHRTAP